MSILGDLFESTDKQADKGGDEEFLVFGYGCKLYRNDAKSILENSGQLLIPWMGDRSLMVDRYDVRNKLDDKSRFGLKSNLPRPMSSEAMDLEDELDNERYLALEWDEIRVEEQEEMEKRKNASAYSAIGFSYDSPSVRAREEGLDGVPLDDVARPRARARARARARDVLPYDYNLSKRMEHPSTASVDCGAEDDQFMPQPEFLIPSGIQIPSTNKLHSIIEKTASFVCKQGNQMEIIIKTKQKFNPYFSFLNHEDGLYPYYRHLKEVISSGTYVPPVNPIRNGLDNVKSTAVPPVNSVRNGVDTNERKNEEEEGAEEGQKKFEEQKASPEPACEVVGNGTVSKTDRRRSRSNSVNESDSDDSDSDDGYLHPLLLGGASASKSNAASPAPPPTSESSSVTAAASSDSNTKMSEPETKKMSLDAIMNLHNTSVSFMARSRAINSAPVAAPATEGEATRAYSTDPNADPEAIAAYEYYKQQYYNNSNMAAPAPVAMEGQEGWYGYDQPTGDCAAVYEGTYSYMSS